MAQTKEEKAAYQKAYRNRPEAKAAAARHNASPKAKETKNRYNATPEAKAKRAKYAASPAGKAGRRRRNSTPEAKAVNAAYTAKPHVRASIVRRSLTPEALHTRKTYNISPAAKAAQAKYNSTPEAKELARQRNASPEAKQTRKEYLATPEGKASSAKYRAKPEIKATLSLRSSIRAALRRGNARKTLLSATYLGCTIPECCDYIANKFLPGMTWDNWTTRGWHLDHIRPIASFDHTVEGWEFAANHYTNLQPLWATENLTKGAKWEPVAQ
jgi:hypothetical protein